MILYTLLPEHIIFQSPEDEYKKQNLVYYNGIPFLVRETESKEYEIIRNLSTNPQHFLEQRYAPGTKLPQNRVRRH